MTGKIGISQWEMPIFSAPFGTCFVTFVLYKKKIPYRIKK